MGVRPSASARPSRSPAGGAGNSQASSPIGEDDDLNLGILLLTFGLMSGAALFFFGRRRAPRGAQLATVQAVVAEPVQPPMLPARRPSHAADDDEAGMPRWLRPSVRAERFWTPEPETPDRQLRARRVVEFTEADVPTDGVRMVVRYDDTTLFDGPNESYAAILGRLHTGDEVLVTRMDDAWAEVRTPKGATGWLPSMTLVAMQAAPPPATPATAASEPAADREVKRPRRRSTPNRRGAPS